MSRSPERLRASSHPDFVAPKYKNIPRWDVTLGPEVAGVCALAGFAPDPEQELLHDVTFGLVRTESGWKSAAGEVANLACRQNMKTGWLKQTAIGHLYVVPQRLIVWSAHESNTAQESHNDLAELITNCDYLRKRTKRVYYGNGDESIETLVGSRIIFRTRTKGGGRGLSGRKVYLDEAFALRPMHMGALIPVLSAQPDPQILYGTSAAMSDSDVEHDLVKRGRSGRDPRLAYIEYCADDPVEACAAGDACTHDRDAEGCACDNPEQWRKANPQAGRRIAISTIEGERRQLPVPEFMRERMGWHDTPAAGVSPIDSIKWANQSAKGTQIVGPVALAVSVRTDGLAASIAVVGRLGIPDGAGTLVADPMKRIRTEIIEHRPGTGWVVDALVALFETGVPTALLLDPGEHAGAFVPDLLKLKFAKPNQKGEVPGDKWRLHLVSTREHAQACGSLLNAIRDDLWRHYDQPPLNQAVVGARLRQVADAELWDRKDSTVDISPLVAATLALLGFTLYPAPHSKKPWAIVG